MTNAEARFNKIHIRKVYACLAVTCHLHFWQNDRDFLLATVVTRGGGTDTEIRVSTESRPWRRKFSRRSSRDSNPRPFNHESGALTTELSPPRGFSAAAKRINFDESAKISGCTEICAARGSEHWAAGNRSLAFRPGLVNLYCYYLTSRMRRLA